MEITLRGIKVTEESRLAYKPNPKREGSKAYVRFETYREAESLTEYFDMVPEKKYARADLRYDWEHGHFAIIEVNAAGDELDPVVYDESIHG